jgi:hypothetical protein
VSWGADPLRAAGVIAGLALSVSAALILARALIGPAPRTWTVDCAAPDSGEVWCPVREVHP